MNGESKKIFLIDDNVDVLVVVKISLEMFGYSVSEFELGTPAIEQFSVDPPDLMIVDQGLPDVDGLDIGRKIRTIEGGQRCKLVLLTGHDNHPLRSMASEAGFDDFIVKPVRINVLTECIARHLGG